MKNKLSHISKKSRMIAATAFVLGLGVVGGAYAYADTTPTTAKNNPMSSLVSAIATKFNLNSSDVESVVSGVMESERSEREAQGKVDQTTKLNQAVTDGKITQAQADLITVKLSEMEATRESHREANQGLTQEEQKTKMQAEQESLKEWATSNNIPMNFLQPMRNGNEGQGRLGGNNGNNKAPKNITQ